MIKYQNWGFFHSFNKHQWSRREVGKLFCNESDNIYFRLCNPYSLLGPVYSAVLRCTSEWMCLWSNKAEVFSIFYMTYPPVCSLSSFNPCLLTDTRTPCLWPSPQDLVFFFFYLEFPFLRYLYNLLHHPFKSLLKYHFLIKTFLLSFTAWYIILSQNIL